MRIKKFSNLWTMGIVLAIGLLVGIYVLKIGYPQLVIEIAQIPSICKIGHYIDTHKWAWYLASGILSYISYYLICGACCSKFKLSGKENLIIFLTIAIVYLIKEYLPLQYTVINYSSLIILPLIMKGYFKNTVICFTSINLLQTITLEIRDLSQMIANINFASLIILMVDVYIFELLLYMIFNNKIKKGV